jgi:hypothetical protein
MLLLLPQHIVDLYVWVDELLPVKTPGPGRPSVLSDSELVTLLIWNAMAVHQKTLKDIHGHARLHLKAEFPRLPGYSAFVAHCHRAAPLMFGLLGLLLKERAPVRLTDSTMLPVCKRYRADQHKVAQRIAKFGKNHQGWHFGFKLHASVDLRGRLCGISLTPANCFDAHQMINTLNENTRIAVGDSTYGASVMRRIIWERYGAVVIAPPHPKQKKKIAAPWQIKLLSWRSKIESVFDILKEHLHLVTSFPRSIFGYLVHYVRILLGYQIMALGSIQ